MAKMNVKIMTFLKIQVGKSLDVIAKLRKIPEVRQISYITGEYDLMFILAAENTQTLYLKFLNDIDQIPEIIESSSHLIIKEWNQDEGEDLKSEEKRF
ncbi:Lrp/AsnC ligand binding domain-containing protein [Candidatus Harpocratesius sp.]